MKRRWERSQNCQTERGIVYHQASLRPPPSSIAIDTLCFRLPWNNKQEKKPFSKKSDPLAKGLSKIVVTNRRKQTVVRWWLTNVCVGTCLMAPPGTLVFAPVGAVEWCIIAKCLSSQEPVVISDTSCDALWPHFSGLRGSMPLVEAKWARNVAGCSTGQAALWQSCSAGTRYGVCQISSSSAHMVPEEQWTHPCSANPCSSCSAI